MRKIAATSALLIGSAVIGCGTANAAPAAQSPVNYVANTAEDGTMTIRTDIGSMGVDNGVFTIKGADGTVVAGTELSFRVDDFVFPVAAQVNDHVATLTPQFDEAHAVYKPVSLPYEDQAPWKTQYDREQAAWNRLAQTITMGATVGTLVGGLGGAAVGCVVGAGVGLVATGVLATLFGLGPLGGCVLGAATVGFLGTIAGQLFVTAPAVIAAAVQYFTTINAPFTPPAPAK
ncbi:membrane protein [Nocardia concava]|uniref:membrane protein n=1 Tax=Nocardia concava TaxID=257281 RepID=UPI0002F9A39B|nr:membrane protein [Nocardia concava]